mmetsp:Transcript_92589/g.266262  ORF Transcript_92589/g.266262 Transcript_92589/m.266262 type:complete len:314 (-) Transcript_92589:147-1088(-)
MAYMELPAALINFDGRTTEIPALGCFGELQEKAEVEFNLQPGSYEFFDACGKVEGAAFQRVVRMAAVDGGPCRFEIRERPEWRKLRELEARIEAVAARQLAPAAWPATASTAAVAAAAADHAACDAGGAGLRLRVAEVEAAMSELRTGLNQLEAKVAGDVSSLAQSLERAYADTKAKLNVFDEADFKSRLRTIEEKVAVSKDLQASALSLDLAALARKSEDDAISACALDLSAMAWKREAVRPPAEPASPLLGARVGALALSGKASLTWQRHSVLKPLPTALAAEADWGPGAARRLDRRSSASRSSPTLPPMS